MSNVGYEHHLNVLVIDGEATSRAQLTSCLKEGGHHVTSVSNSEDALIEVSRRSFDAVLLDSSHGNSNLIETLLAEAPWLRIVVIAANANIATAVDTIRRGACDYVQKPFTPDAIGLAVKRACEGRRREFRSEAPGEVNGHGLSFLWETSKSPVMQRLLVQAEQVASTNASVLLRGEHGTGKTLLARAIHRWSNRGGRQLGVVSCPSLSRQLLESELFGHVKGAFTGAIRDKAGRVEQCDGGTLLLDEIGDLPMDLQPKLLRFLQDKEYERIGDTVTRRADVRLVAATNVDLGKAVAEGQFREDLLYRLNVVEISLPPLRERREDIPVLAEAMLASLADNGEKRMLGFTEEAKTAMMEYDWPGNVRQLKNAIERASIFSASGYIGAELVPDGIRSKVQVPKVGDPVSLAKLEEHHIRRILASSKSLQEAAQILEIDETTLWRRRKRYGI